ncbi:CDP-alcohol phosphatidyltransferase family protein [Rubripirellula amarantea]|nr:CDP-alcohol phosphatidyltransferase family protein [Rubripirellula amarantea]
MPSIYDLKPKFQGLLRPSVTRMATAGVTANQVTVLATMVSILAGSMIAAFPDSKWPLAILPVTLLFRMSLNAVDGMLAREFGQKSRLGAVLNELGDVISDIALYLPLAMVPDINSAGVIGFVIASVVVEFTGVIALQVGSERRYDGPMGKSDRAFWIGLLATLLALGWMRPNWTLAYFAVLIFLTILTIGNRASRALGASTKN